MHVSSKSRKQTLSWASERVVFDRYSLRVYTKSTAFRKSIFVQKGGRFANVFLVYKIVKRRKAAHFWVYLLCFESFSLHADSICESVAFLPCFHRSVQSYTTSLQKRRNSQVTQRYCEDGAAGIASLSMLCRID